MAYLLPGTRRIRATGKDSHAFWRLGLPQPAEGVGAPDPILPIDQRGEGRRSCQLFPASSLYTRVPRVRLGRCLCPIVRSTWLPGTGSGTASSLPSFQFGISRVRNRQGSLPHCSFHLAARSSTRLFLSLWEWEDWSSPCFPQTGITLPHGQ